MYSLPVPENMFVNFIKKDTQIKIYTHKDDFLLNIKKKGKNN